MQLARFVVLLTGIAVSEGALAARAGAETERWTPMVLPAAGTRLATEPVRVDQSARIHFTELAHRAARAPSAIVPAQRFEPNREPAPPEPDVSAPPIVLPPPVVIDAPSPAPANQIPGLGDIGFGGTSYIPPDVDGAVGRTAILEGLNNYYQVLDKGSGAIQLSVPIGAFWAAAGAGGIFDPKALYDSVNDRFIVCAVSDGETANSSIVVGVSESGDPAGGYFLFRVRADTTGARWADFPCIGFNKNWVAINVNMFPLSGGSGVVGKCLVVNYPLLRSGTLGAVFVTGTNFCSSPAATYSATENTLYVPTHINSGTYRLDTITGTPASPVYTIGANKNRGLTWSNPGGNLLPQSAPIAGVSSCGATPCKLEVQDAPIRTTPVVRDGSLYYVQTVGVPASLARTAVQWTRLDPATAAVVDGGRIEDPTATATNGGKWYAYPSIAVNRFGDFIIGFSQFSSA